MLAIISIITTVIIFFSNLMPHIMLMHVAIVYLLSLPYSIPLNVSAIIDASILVPVDIWAVSRFGLL